MLTFSGHVQDGVVVLDRACPLPDGTQVTVNAPESAACILPSRSHVELALEIAATIPDEDWEALPRDGASNVDHYLYGAAKNPE